MNGFGKVNRMIYVEYIQQQIKTLLIESCNGMKSDYLANSEKIKNGEGAITYRLVEKYLNNDEFRKEKGLSNMLFRFVPEVPTNFSGEKNQYIGRLDLQVINNDYLHNVNAYSVVECKRLDGSSTLYNEYVKEGISRFVGVNGMQMKYLRHIGIDMMLGYFVKASGISTGYKEINRGVQSYMPQNVINFLDEKDKITDCWYYYDSRFICCDGDNRNIYHLLYDLSAIIE